MAELQKEPLIQMSQSDYRKRMFLAAAAALLFGAGTAFLFLTLRADDEDRPPIIVKNGSLIFESGDDEVNPGFDWETPNAADEWHPKHDRGRPTRRFHVIFVGGTGGGCTARYSTKVVVYYKADSEDQPRQYTVDIRQRGAKKGPAVAGSGLVADNLGNVKRLTFGTPGAITRVDTEDGQQCTAPVWLMLRPLK